MPSFSSTILIHTSFLLNWIPFPSINTYHVYNSKPIHYIHLYTILNRLNYNTYSHWLTPLFWLHCLIDENIIIIAQHPTAAIIHFTLVVNKFQAIRDIDISNSTSHLAFLLYTALSLFDKGLFSLSIGALTKITIIDASKAVCIPIVESGAYFITINTQAIKMVDRM